MDEDPLVRLPSTTKSCIQQEPLQLAVPTPNTSSNFEAKDWVDKNQKQRTQKELFSTQREKTKLCDKQIYPTVSNKAMIMPKDEEYRKYWSICLDEDTEIVARTVAYKFNRVLGEEQFQEKDIESCALCEAAYVFHDVVVCMVYIRREDDSLLEEMTYKDSTTLCCFYHFVDFGVDNIRKPAGQKRKRTKD